MVGAGFSRLVRAVVMNRGFTLVELLIAITIFTLITLAAVVNFRGADPSKQISLQAANVVSSLRQAQVQAQGGEPFNGSLPQGGYGVAVSACSVPPCSVTIFADQNGNFAMESPAEIVQTVSLGSQVTITGVSIGGPAHILFRLPSAAVCFNNTCSGSAPATITLGAVGTSVTKTITINQLSGQISY